MLHFCSQLSQSFDNACLLINIFYLCQFMVCYCMLTLESRCILEALRGVPIFRCTNVHPERMLAHPAFLDVMSQIEFSFGGSTINFTENQLRVRLNLKSANCPRWKCRFTRSVFKFKLSAMSIAINKKS